MRKTVSVLLALALCLSLTLTAVPKATAATGDEIRAAKKIISVVYDDSASMYGDRWVYASYAMQALTALLNTQDELYLTYMSQPAASSQVDLSDLQASVNRIGSWAQSADTPGLSLDTAKARLDGISESDAATQFWLVILTDGVIQLNSTIQHKLNSFKGAKMSNGSTLNIVYLAMGSGATAASDDTKNGLHTFKAKDLDDITNVMGQIANLISSRLTADHLRQVDDTTISFQSELPLYSISVLAQESSAAVTFATTGEEDLNINRNIALSAYEPFYNSLTQLYGNAAVLNLVGANGVSRVIPAGTYTIQFSEPVDVADLLVQYEPAIGMKMKVTRNGVEVQDTGTLAIGEKVDIEVVPVIPGTDQEIPRSSLPSGIEWNIEYFVDNNLADSNDSNKLTDVTLLDGNNMIRGTMQLPGFAPSVFDIYFFIEEIIYNFGIQTDQPDPLTYYRRNDTGGSVEGGTLTFRITNDGVPLTLDELKSLNLKLEVKDVSCDNSAVEGFLDRFGKIPASCTLKQQSDGSYTLTPNPIVPFTSFLTMAGDYKVTVCLSRDETVTADGTFTLAARAEDWTELGALALTIFTIGYLIYILFIKYKFSGQTICYEAYKLRTDGTGIELVNDAYTKQLGPLTLDLLLPKRACEVKFNGLTIQAGPDGSAIITGKSIARQVSHYTASGSNPKTALGQISSCMRATAKTKGKKTEYTASDQSVSSSRPVYFRSAEGDRTIWCIHFLDAE